MAFTVSVRGLKEFETQYKTHYRQEEIQKSRREIFIP